MLRNWVYSIKTCLFSNEQAWANPTFGFIFKHLIMNRTLKIESKIVWIFIIWTRTIYNPFPNTYLFSKFCNFQYWSLLFVIWEKLELMHPLLTLPTIKFKPWLCWKDDDLSNGTKWIQSRKQFKVGPDRTNFDRTSNDRQT